MEHKEICLETNGKQSVKLESDTIKFKNYFKQISVLFKIYADFESLLKKLQINDRDKNTSYTEKYQHHIPYSFAYKVACIDDKFSKLAALYRGKNAVNRFIEAILEEYDYCKMMIKNILIKMLSCLQKMKEDFNLVINVGYIINYLLMKIKK